MVILITPTAIRYVKMSNKAWHVSPPDECEQNVGYANYFKVGHNAFEFILDFGQSYTENEEVRYFARIIINPNSIKDLFKILQESIVQYEQSHGAIGIQDHDS